MKLTYPNGNEIKIGDKVTFEDSGQKLIGQVEDIINSEEKKKNWNVENFGIMIKESKVFGVVFYPENFITKLNINII